MAAREDWSTEAGRIVTGVAELVVALGMFAVSAAFYIILAAAVIGIILFGLRQL